MKKGDTKKLLNHVIIFLLSVFFIFNIDITIYAKDVNVNISNANCIVGQTVRVNVTITKAASVQANFRYDTEALEFVGGTLDSNVMGGVNGGNGEIVMSVACYEDTTISASLQFKVKKPGQHKVYITAESAFTDINLDDMNLVATTGVITATSEAPVSADNNLKDLTVYVEDENGNTTNGWYWPAFNKDTTQYYLNVESNAKKLAITANANSQTSTVSLNNPELAVGNNNITITVKAQDGSTKNYVIAVTKAEKNTEKESESESQKEDETTGVNSSGKTVNIGDKTYTIADVNEQMTLPEGYEIIDYDYKGNNIKALKGLGTGLILMAFTDIDSNIQIFVYDAVADDFYKFITANVKSAQYVLVDMPSTLDNISIPSNYKLSSINYDNSVLVAYVSDDSKIYIVSAIDCNGKKGLYYLDSENNTIMRYFENTNVVPANTSTNTNTNDNSNDSDELYKVKTQNRIILIVSVTIGLVMLGVILALLVSRRNEKEDEEYSEEDEEYSEEDEEYSKDGEEYSRDDEEYAKDDEKYSEDNKEYAKDDEKYSEDNKEYAEKTEEYTKEDNKEYADGSEEYSNEDSNSNEKVNSDEAADSNEEGKNIEKEDDFANNTQEVAEEITTHKKVKELLDDDSTSLKEDELDMVLDELLSDILDGDKK